jgi:hypothetical protein
MSLMGGSLLVFIKLWLLNLSCRKKCEVAELIDIMQKLNNLNFECTCHV